MLNNIDDITNAEQTYNDLISHECVESKKSAEERSADAILNRIKTETRYSTRGIKKDFSVYK